MRHNQSAPAFMDVLRTGDAFPPFAEIEQLVMVHERRAIPIIWKTLAAIVAGAIVFVFLLPNSRIPQITGESQHVNASSRSADAVISHADNPEHVNRVNPANPAVLSGVGNRLVATERKNEGVSTPNNNTESALESEPECKSLPNTTISSQGIPKSKATIEQSQPTLSTLSVSSGDLDIHKRWAAYGTLGYVLSGSPLMSPGLTQFLTGSAGIRMRWNDASSVSIEVRRNTFHTRHSVTNIVNHDTTISLNGTSYVNTIGTPTTTQMLQTTFIGSLNVGYRFELLPMGNITPFGEVFLGASTTGGLTSEIVGLRYQYNSQVLFDLSARADQLISPKSSPLRSIGFEGTVGFAW